MFLDSQNWQLSSPLPHFPGITTGQIHPGLADKRIGVGLSRCIVANQLRLVVYPIIYRVSYIAGGARFLHSFLIFLDSAVQLDKIGEDAT